MWDKWPKSKYQNFKSTQWFSHNIWTKNSKEPIGYLHNWPLPEQHHFLKIQWEIHFLTFLKYWTKRSKKKLRIEIWTFSFQICFKNQFSTLGSGQTENIRIRIRASATNTFVINWLINSVMVCENIFMEQPRPNGCRWCSHNICHNFLGESKSRRASKLHNWFKSYGDFAEGVDFPNWWSFNGKGLLLQPAQQACFLPKRPVLSARLTDLCRLCSSTTRVWMSRYQTWASLKNPLFLQTSPRMVLHDLKWLD